MAWKEVNLPNLKRTKKVRDDFTRTKVSLKMKDRWQDPEYLEKMKGAKRKPTQIVEWSHPEHGDVTCGVTELSERFGLDKSTLNTVKNGKRNNTKGWHRKDTEFVPPKNPYEKHPSRFVSKRWVHPELGEFVGTCGEIAEAFKEYSMQERGFHRCVTGKSKGYKKWFIKGNPPQTRQGEVFDFHHPEHGNFKGSMKELRKNHLSHLAISSLYGMKRGREVHGWSIRKS